MGIGNLDKIPGAYATPSLGMHPSYTVELKLEAASKAGFKGEKWDSTLFFLTPTDTTPASKAKTISPLSSNQPKNYENYAQTSTWK
jgi:hypothetical protein